MHQLDGKPPGRHRITGCYSELKPHEVKYFRKFNRLISLLAISGVFLDKSINFRVLFLCHSTEDSIEIDLSTDDFDWKREYFHFKFALEYIEDENDMYKDKSSLVLFRYQALRADQNPSYSQSSSRDSTLIMNPNDGQKFITF